MPMRDKKLIQQGVILSLSQWETTASTSISTSPTTPIVRIAPFGHARSHPHRIASLSLSAQARSSLRENGSDTNNFMVKPQIVLAHLESEVFGMIPRNKRE